MFQQSLPTPASESQREARVPDTFPWWVRDCDSKVTEKVSVGHAELSSSIVTWPFRPS